MKKIIYLSILIILQNLLINSQTSWILQSPLSVWPLTGVQFLTADTGYIIGPSGTAYRNVFKTTNAGQTWVLLTDSSLYNLYSICFINVNTGYVGNFNGGVRKTTNGGLNWTARNINIGSFIRSLTFFNENTGFASVGTNTIFKTTNSGLNWNAITLGNTSYHLQSTIMLNPDTIITVGSNGSQGIMLTSTNSGSNWIENSHQGYLMTNVAFFNNLTGYACGGAIYKTTNSGLNWIPVNLSLGNSLYSICTPGPDNVCAVGLSGYITITNNGGNNWISSVPYSTRFLNDVYFINALTGWAVGDSGIVIKTTNGGITFIENNLSEISENFSLSQNYPNPFNPTTKIKFAIPQDSRFRGNDKVFLKVYDALGREVQTLVNEQLQPGTYEVDFPAPSGDASNFSSGVYYYTLIAGNYSQTKKMVLFK